jgi:hypothetical protein
MKHSINCELVFERIPSALFSEINACIGGATALAFLSHTSSASSLVYRAADSPVSGAIFSGLYRSAGSTVGNGQVVQDDVLAGSGVNVIDPVVARYLIGSGELMG